AEEKFRDSGPSILAPRFLLLRFCTTGHLDKPFGGDYQVSQDSASRAKPRSPVNTRSAYEDFLPGYVLFAHNPGGPCDSTARASGFGCLDPRLPAAGH